MKSTLTRRAALSGAVVMAAAAPAAAAGTDDLSQIERLIEAHKAAETEHDRLFDLNDQGLVHQDEVIAALDPLDDALIALCAARPTSDRARKRRWAYLSKRLVPDTYCNEVMARRVFEAAFA